MTPDEIRALYVETLARAEYERDRELNVFPRKMPPWQEASEEEREDFRQHAVPHLIAALAEAGLLPTREDHRVLEDGWASSADVGKPNTRQRCYATGWVTE